MLMVALYAGLLVFGVLVVLAQRERRRGHPPQADLLHSITVMGQHLPPTVIAFLQAGRKVDAVRALRDETGLELRDAYEMIEKLGSGRARAGEDLLTAQARIERALSQWRQDSGLADLIRAERWQEARRYLREVYELDAHDSALVIDRLALRLNGQS